MARRRNTMKVLCLYNEMNHTEPLQRCRRELAERGIQIAFADCNSFAKACQTVTSDVDALLVHQVLLCDEIFACGPPVIILERIDGAQLAGGRAWLPQAAGMIKGYTFRDPQMNNSVRGRWFPHLLVSAGVGPTQNTRALVGRPDTQLSDTDLAKIRLGYSFPSYACMGRYVNREPEWDKRRGCDLHCVGWTEYKGTEVELHRKHAVKIVREFNGEILADEGRPYHHIAYMDHLYNAKCVLSPWGWGEPCFRDVEAMLAGAIVIKPDTNYVAAWPDIYTNNLYYPCKPDLSDVHEIARRVCDTWNGHLGMRRRAREACIDGYLPNNVANAVAAALWGAMNVDV